MGVLVLGYKLPRYTLTAPSERPVWPAKAVACSSEVQKAFFPLTSQ